MLKYFDILMTLTLLLILSVSMLWPIDRPPQTPEGIDRLIHLIAFAALAFPLATTGRISLLPVLIGASAFGGMIEMLQPSFNRSSDYKDWMADTFGAVLGIACGLLHRKLRKL